MFKSRMPEVLQRILGRLPRQTLLDIYEFFDDDVWVTGDSDPATEVREFINVTLLLEESRDAIGEAIRGRKKTPKWDDSREPPVRKRRRRAS